LLAASFGHDLAVEIGSPAIDPSQVGVHRTEADPERGRDIGVGDWVYR
jgi:hypothetical protein